MSSALTAQHLEHGLAIKRGLQRLHDVPEAQRAGTAMALREVRDGEWSEIAMAREAATRTSKASRLVWRPTRAARS